MWTESWLESVAQDIQYAVRSLRRQPGFAATALLTLGVTTGLASGVATGFSALFRQLWDVPRSAEVAQLLPGRNRTEMSYAAYRELAAHAQLSTLVATNCGVRPRFEDCKVKIDHEPETALFVSGNYFSVLGIGMHLGRSFGPSDDELLHPLTVVIISHALWQRRFGSDRGIVGRTIDIDAVSFTIIGVASRSFAGTSMVRTTAWLPIAASELLRPASQSARFVHVAARVGPRVFRAQAEAELQSLDRASAPHDPRRGQVRLVNTTLFPDRIRRSRRMSIFFSVF